MAIRLTIEAEDPEVEQLLSFLQENCQRQTADKIYLLEKALKWLRSMEAIAYGINSEDASIDLSLPQTCAAHSWNSDTRSSQPRH